MIKNLDNEKIFNKFRTALLDKGKMEEILKDIKSSEFELCKRHSHRFWDIVFVKAREER